MVSLCLPAAVWAGQKVVDVCSNELQGGVDLADPHVKPLPNIPSLMIARMTRQPVGAIPELQGLHKTRKVVRRFKRPIGLLGRTEQGKYVVLQPIDLHLIGTDDLADVYLTLKKLAENNMAVPILGWTKIGGMPYLVRPLVYGSEPFAFWGASQAPIRFQHILDLEKIGEFLRALGRSTVQFGAEFVVPAEAYVNVGLWPGTDRDRVEGVSEYELRNTVLSRDYAFALEAFLGQVRFVMAPDGHLLIEDLEPKPLRLQDQTEFRMSYIANLDSWWFGRWTWYRYMLAAKLDGGDKPQFEEWLRGRERVGWQRQYMFLASLIAHSPEFLLPEVPLLNQPYISMVVDALMPFPRPTGSLKFKDNSSLRYHFRKHGNEMGYLDEAEYLAAAIDFIRQPPSEERLYFTRVRNGDIVLTDVRVSKMAVFSSDGKIRTFMKPSANFHGHEHDAYYIYEQMMGDLNLID